MTLVAEHGFHCRVRSAVNSHDAFARDVDAGLGGTPKTVPCRWLFDARGSHLFDEVVRQPEYYLSAAESEILRRHAEDIAAAGGARQMLVELGPNDGAKARPIVDAILHRQSRLTFRPVDGSEGALRQGCAPLLRDFHSLNVDALATDIEDGLDAIFSDEPPPMLIAFLGSNFGLFGREEGLLFLSNLRLRARPFDLFLLGLDLQKKEAAMIAAYNDAAGATARFNLHILRRINHQLGGDFPEGAFEHTVRYEAADGRVDLQLRCREARFVRVEKLDRYFWFEAGECVRTKSARKFTRFQVAEMCALTGWSELHEWTDDQNRYLMTLLAPSPHRGLWNSRGISPV